LIDKTIDSLKVMGSAVKTPTFLPQQGMRFWDLRFSTLQTAILKATIALQKSIEAAMRN